MVPIPFSVDLVDSECVFDWARIPKTVGLEDLPNLLLPRVESLAYFAENLVSCEINRSNALR